MGNRPIDTDGRVHVGVEITPAEGSDNWWSPRSERRAMIRRFHEIHCLPATVFLSSDPSVLAGMYTRNVRTYVASCTVWPCKTYWTCQFRRQREIVMYWSWWIASLDGRRPVLLSDKTAISVADAFFSNIVCRFGMPSVIHSDQGWEFENKVMHELCILGGSHKTKATPYHPESDGLVERFNRTLLMMLAMFAGEHKEDWDDLLPPVMMAYRMRCTAPDDGIEIVEEVTMLSADALPESSQLIPPLILPVVVEEVALASETGVPSLILLVVEELVDDTPAAELFGEKPHAPEYRPRQGFLHSSFRRTMGGWTLMTYVRGSVELLH